MTGGKAIFIVERPLQIMTAIAIYEQCQFEGLPEVAVANCFSDAPAIAHRFSKIFSHVFDFSSVPDYKSAIDRCKNGQYDHVFLHWDIGFGTNLRLRSIQRRNTGVEISVFEEGIGTYRDDIYPPFKKMLFNFLGLPVNNGGSNFSKKIYVYDPEEYLRKVTKPAPEVIKIVQPLSKLIVKYERQFLQVFDPDCFVEHNLENLRGKVCVIYLSDWDFLLEQTCGVFSEDSFNILKLHPHNKSKIVSDGSFMVAPNSLPAELLIISAARKFAEVRVFHRGSSAQRYINIPNVKFIRHGEAALVSAHRHN